MQCAVRRGNCADVFGEERERAVVRFNLGCDGALRLECASRLSLPSARVAASQSSKKQWNRSPELVLVYVKGAGAGE
jgi:hypothetical protein